MAARAREAPQASMGRHARARDRLRATSAQPHWQCAVARRLQQVKGNFYHPQLGHARASLRHSTQYKRVPLLIVSDGAAHIVAPHDRLSD